MKRLLTLLIVMSLFCVYAFAGQNTVKDDNDGNAGYIFVATGTQQGNSNVGHWTNPTELPELKGDKGDAGINGTDGTNGTNGTDGTTPVKGVDYIDGINGTDGVTPVKGKDYFDGLNGTDGINGKDVDPTTVDNLKSTDSQLSNRIDSLNSRLNRLERTQFVAEFEFRVFDSKRLTISPFIRQNFTRSKLDTVGVRFTIKLGKSYEEKLIEKTNSRLSSIEIRLNHTPVI